MSNLNMKLIVSIIKYLKNEGKRSDMSADTKESLEVAVQCLQTAYEIDDKDCDSPDNTVPFSLEDIFTANYVKTGNDDQKLERAEVLKNSGNDHMKTSHYDEAIKCYSAAIELDNKNAIYYGNRAAAYSKLNEFEKAIKDCEKAIEIDPGYAKAHGRMGLAYASLEKHDQAIKAFRSAIVLDPTNESYQSNLKLALEKKENPSNKTSENFGGPSGINALNGIDWHALFTNPGFRNMATSLMQNPQLISALSAGMMSSFEQEQRNRSQTTDTGDTTSGTAPPSDDILFRAGQFLSAQMEAIDPSLAEQFRQTTSSTLQQNTDNSQNSNNKDSSTK